MVSKSKLLIISTVLPFPRNSGQRQRVYYKLKAFQDHFHVTFLSTADKNQIHTIRKRLLNLCDDVILLPSCYSSSKFSKLWHKLVGAVYTWQKGLKFSNYMVGKVEFSPDRIESALGNKCFDLVLYEYWHAVDSTIVFQKQRVPTVLDMHNLLWQSFERQLDAKPYLLAAWKNRNVERYKQKEESAWRQYDALIAINKGEYEYTLECVPENIRVFYTPMGTDLSAWPYCWQPAEPLRLAYYGGLGSPHNQHDALSCYREIMPFIWKRFPEIELWLVGSNPPEFLQKLPRQDSRVVVTGFVERVQDVLKTIALILCPWTGTYGFRSRIIEVMALGVPVVASPDAVYGMGMDPGRGLFLKTSPSDMARAAIDLLSNKNELHRQSKLARQQTEEKFSFEATYGALASNLMGFIKEKGQSRL